MAIPSGPWKISPSRYLARRWWLGEWSTCHVLSPLIYWYILNILNILNVFLIYKLLHHPKSSGVISRHSEANRYRCSYHSIVVLIKCIGLQGFQTSFAAALRCIWGTSWWWIQAMNLGEGLSTTAMLGCSVPLGFLMISMSFRANQRRCWFFGYATQPAQGAQAYCGPWHVHGREWELVPSSKLRTGITEREFLTARPSTLEQPEPFHVLFRPKEGVNGLALNGTTPLPPCFQTSASTLLTT